MAAEPTWVELLRRRAQSYPNRHAYSYFSHDRSGQVTEKTLTYGELDRRACAIAASLQGRVEAGSRVALLYPPGLDYIEGFFGCLYAGVVAVPAYPPERGRAQRTLPRLRAIAKDADVSVILSTVSALAGADGALGDADFDGLPIIHGDAVETSAAGEYRPPSLRASDVALLQYTSGSTSEPRGVVLTHANMLANAAAGRVGWRLGESSRGVSWLPLYHDLGVLTVLLQPIVVGFPTLLMAPSAFVQNPFRWLEAMSRHGGTFGGGPNFMYELCVRHTTAEQRASLDLRAWDCAFNGAEPVRKETIDRFCDAFAISGFRRSAMYPCYGLAEANFVAGPLAFAPPTVQHFEKSGLEQRRAIPTEAENVNAYALVSSGQALEQQHIVVVHPEDGTPCSEGEVGEVWLGGPSVSQGYFRRDNTRDFQAFLAAPAAHCPNFTGPFFRTGDLGILRSGEIFVAGRLKDLIIVRGVNHFPQDIERTVESCDSALRAGCGAAFSVDVDGSEQLVVVQEYEGDLENADAVIAIIRTSITQIHGIEAWAIVLIGAGCVPKTTSGKIQRSACRSKFSADGFDALASYRAERKGPNSATFAVGARPADSERPRRSSGEISQWLVARLAERLGIDAKRIDPSEPFASYGLDSSSAVRLSGELSTWLACHVEATVVYDYPNVSALARHLGGESVETQRLPDAVLASSANEPIAIVGIGCRFPGASGPREFLKLLVDGVDAIREVPADRWDSTKLYDRDPNRAGKTNSRWGGFIEQVDQFDPLFFGISPREATHMDPQQRLLLEVAWEALEDAGQVPAEWAGSNTGVFVGITTDDYGRKQLSRRGRIGTYSATGSLLCIAANRISYAFDFRGPSLAIDTACSSSLVSVQQACDSLRSGQSTMALAGGVNLILSPENSIGLSKLGALSPDGRSKAFDVSANGYVRGEGAGLLVLKTLSRATADGDRIYALILGGAINQDGRSNGLTAPNAGAQVAVIRAAQANAGVSPAAIQCIEAHGTGTSLGDAIELGALSTVLQPGRPADDVCALGSVKTNIGHLESAAGVAGLIKMALSLDTEVIPASLHFSRPTDEASYEKRPIRVNAAKRAWPRGAKRRLAGVSSFGIGGTNAHVVVSEAPAATRSNVEGPGPYLLPLSARTPEALSALAASYATFVQTSTDSLADICFTASVRRSHHREHRLAVVAESRAEVATKLASFARQETVPGLFVSPPREGKPKVAFVFAGHGAQWVGMGQGAYRAHSVFREALRKCDAALTPLLGWSIERALIEADDLDAFERTARVQPLVFAVQVATAALWSSWGIEPEAVLGHSLGEVAAAHVAGILSLADAAKVIVLRSATLARAAGKVVFVALSAKQAQAAIAHVPTRAAVAAINGPRASVISGDQDVLAEVVATLEARQVVCRWLKSESAVHSPLLDPHLDGFRRALGTIDASTARVPFYSTVEGRVLSGSELDASYWVRNLREPVVFSASVDKLIDDGFDTVLEVAPRSVLAASLRDAFQARTASVRLAVSESDRAAWADAALTAIAALYTNGSDVRLSGYFGAAGDYRCVSLPNYAWQRQRYWIDESTDEGAGNSQGTEDAHPLLARHVEAADPYAAAIWEVDVGAKTHPFIADHVIEGNLVFNSLAAAEMALAAAGTREPNGAWCVSNIAYRNALLVPPTGLVTMQLSLTSTRAVADDAPVPFAIFSRPRGGGTWTKHYSGAVEPLPVAPPLPVLDAAARQALAARCPEEVSGKAFFDRMRKLGMQFGPQFRGLSRVLRGDGEALGEVIAPESVVGELAAYHFHPALLDACAEVLVAMERDARSFLPIGIGKIAFYGRPTERLWAHAKRRAAGNADELIGDIDVFDQDGRLIAQIIEAKLKLLDRVADRDDADMDDAFYAVEWRPAGEAHWMAMASSHSATRREPRTYLVVGQDSVGELLAAASRSRGDRGIVARSGTAYQREAADRFTIRAGASEDIARLLRDVRDDSPNQPITDIVHCFGRELAAEADGEGLAPAELKGLLTEGPLTIAALAKASANDPRPPRSWLVTQRAVCTDSREATHPAQALAWGIGRSLAAEQPSMWGGLIDIGDEADLAFALRFTDRDADADDQVAVRGGRLLSARLVRTARPERRPQASSQIRPDATYLVTGGLSGVGLRAAHWLVECGAKRLVLVGRTPLPSRSEWSSPGIAPATSERIAAVRDLEARGALVLPSCIDIADERAVAELRQSLVREGWPEIRGIIHSAGVGHLAALPELTGEGLMLDAHPKVLGTWVLHRAFPGRALDFFLLYSSTSSLIPSPRLGGYAAANSFLDAFAQYRRSRGEPALSITWGMFSEVGMSARLEASRGHEGRLRGGSFTPAQAMEAQRDVMRMVGSGQTVIAKIDWTEYVTANPDAKRNSFLSELLQSVNDAHRDAPQKESNIDRTLLAAAPSKERKAQLLPYLKLVIAETLGLPEERIAVDGQLSHYGLDSLMATRIRSRIATDIDVVIPLLSILEKASIATLMARIDEQLGDCAPERAVKPARVAPTASASTAASGSAIERAQERWLSPSIRPVATSTPAREPGALLVTGATGYLGSFMLAELLAETSATAYCLVRADNQAQGLARIRETLRQNRLWDESLETRIVPVIGDLSQPGLGVNKAKLDELGAEIDAIYHCGAMVNFLLSYADMRPANVDSTLDLLRLATVHHNKPLHFVSSISAFFAPHYSGKTILETEDPRGEPPAAGYAHTKWASDRIVALARGRHIPVATYRPGFVGWHTRTGVFNDSDFVSRLILACLEMGIAPELAMRVSVAPVDYVSKALVRLSLQTQSIGKSFHLVHPHPPTWTEIATHLERLGAARRVPFAKWRHELERRAAASARNEFRLLLPFFPEDLSFTSVLGENSSVSFDDRNVRAGLAHTNVACPPIDEAHLSKFIERSRELAGTERRAG